MRGDISAGTEQLLSSISIHASTWEATFCNPLAVAAAQISIHASTWKATSGRKQSTEHTEQISIHASTWEATTASPHRRLHRKISIHASTWEATPPQSALIVGSSTFQFTPLHERHREEVIPMETEGIFQFTPLHERQLTQKAFTAGTNPFQFTPLHERQPPLSTQRRVAV